MKQILFSLLASFVLTACSGTSSSSKGVVAAIPIRASRVSNYSQVTFGSLAHSSASFVPGAYTFTYTRTPAALVTLIDQNVNAVWNVTIDSTQATAQSFTPVNDANVSVISPELQWTGGESVTISVYSVGIPGQGAGTPVLLGTSSQVLAGAGTGPVNFTFSPSPPILGGQTYYFTVEVSGGGSILWFSNSNDTGYLGGTAYSRAPGLSNYQPNNYDMTFSIQVYETTHAYSYNSIVSNSFSQYPAGQAVTIDGGAAGKLTFVPDPTPPVAATTSDVVAAVK